MAKKSNYIAGLDIGTTKICCIIGEVIYDEKKDLNQILLSQKRGTKYITKI